MCNLYHVAPENSLEQYIRRHLGKVKLPDSYPPKPTVGPFDAGMSLTADADGGLVGRLGQWGMIRAGQKGRIEYKERPPKKPGGKPVREPLLKNNARRDGRDLAGVSGCLEARSSLPHPGALAARAELGIRQVRLVATEAR